MKIKKISTVWYIALGVAVLGVAAWALSSGKKKEEVSFAMEAPAATKIQNSVTATGSVHPVDTVAIGTQVSGIIDKIYVDYNSTVKRGQVLAELDKKNLTSTLRSARAELAMARASLASAQASASYQKANFARQKELWTKGLVSADEYESAQLAYLQAHETVAQKQQSVVSAQEKVRTAETNLSYATITSPIDGVVTGKYVAEGQTVAASFSTPQLFGVARNLADMQVEADVDEADIADVAEGKNVRFTVDAYPDDTFAGKVTQVRLGAATSNNVVTYKVIISADNADHKLKPGMTANVTIYTAERDGVLAVSNKALRFTPTPETVGGRRIEDCKGKNKVWTIDGNTVRAVPVSLGVSDGTHTQVTAGLRAGQQVITELRVSGADEAQGEQETNPFGPKMPKRNNKK